MAVFDGGKVTVGKAATKIVTLPAACSVYLVNHGTEQVFLSSSSTVTPATGVVFPPYHPIVMSVTAGATLYAVSANGSAEIHYLTGA